MKIDAKLVRRLRREIEIGAVKIRERDESRAD